ncbi:MAG: aspartate/glutamate racemase family protein [Chloroflexi bacterium]|nr:aspartate/glutamate racemase family protein [Chloroflexota bacterium]
MRLCVVQIMDMPAKYCGPVLDSLKPSFGTVLRPDTEVVLKTAKGGLKGDNVADPDNPYFAFLNKRPIIEAFIEAEKEGFDAAWVNCFGDPGVREARSVVGMPIFGPCESTLLFACQLGRKLAIITANMPGQIAQMEDQVREHGLEGRLIDRGVRPDRLPFAETWRRSQKNPKFAAESVAEVARECVADGADVIVVGCCGLGPLCSAAGFNTLTIGEQRVPVLDPVMIAAKTAEMAVDIKKATGLPIPSRVRNYVLPSKNDWTRVRTVFGLPS